MADGADRAYVAGLNLLARRELAEAQLRTHLAKRKFDDDDIDAARLGFLPVLHARNDMDPGGAGSLDPLREEGGVSGARHDDVGDLGDAAGERDLQQLRRVAAQERDVHGEASLRRRFRLRDLPAEQLLGHGPGADAAEDSGLGAGDRQAIPGSPDHARLEDGITGAENLGDAGRNRLDHARSLRVAPGPPPAPAAGGHFRPGSGRVASTARCRSQ